MSGFLVFLVRFFCIASPLALFVFICCVFWENFRAICYIHPTVDERDSVFEIGVTDTFMLRPFDIFQNETDPQTNIANVQLNEIELAEITHEYPTPLEMSTKREDST